MTLTRRVAVPADLDQVLKVYNAYDIVEMGQSEIEPSDIEGMIALADSDTIVAEDDGNVVGFADVGGSGEVETVVDPSYDGYLALQRELLQWVLARAGERGIARVEHWAGTDPTRAAVLLTEAGFAHARTLWRMGRSVDGELPLPVWPAGVSVRGFEPARDAQRVWEVVQTSFAGSYGSHARPFEEWALFALGENRDVICAVQDDDIVAVATVGIRSGAGHVGQLAVLPDHRGRGLGQALLHAAFRRDASLGLAATTLTVDGENATARRLYEKAGMRVQAEYRRWERDV